MVKRNINIKDFYKNFNDKKSINNDYSLYRKVVKTFLTVYFREVMFSDKPIYFIFGGKIKKIQVGNFFGKNNVKEKKMVYLNLAVGFEWFERPCKTMEAQLRLRKLNGSTSSLTKIIKEWTKDNDISTLNKRSPWQDRD